MATTRKKAPAIAAPPRYHHGDLRMAMLAAAQDLLEREGLEALTLRAAARAAGVSHAAPMNHFGDLTGLLSELAAVGFHDFARALLDAAEAAGTEADARARFDAIGKAYVRFARERRAMFLLMFRSERLDMSRPALRDAVEASRWALAGAAASRLGIAAERQSQITPEQSATMVAAWSLVHGFAMLLIDGRLDTVMARRQDGGDWQALLDAVFAVRSAR